MKFLRLLGFCFACAITNSLPAAERPNVLLICVDDLKPVLGCYGDAMVKTPNFDRLAARSLVFDRAYCNQAVCAPSRNSLLTGLRPQTLGIYDLGTNFRRAVPNAVTLPQAFKNRGWRTEALGKIFHVGHGNHEDAASWTTPHFSVKSIAYHLPDSRARAGLTREEALFDNQSASNLPRGAPYESADVEDEAYPDGQLAAEAVKRLKAAPRNQPFFLALGFVKPHLPFCSPKKYWDLYDPAIFKLPELQQPPDGAPAYAQTTWGELRQYSDMPDAGPVSPDQARKLIHGYHAAVSFVDAQLGKVIAALDELGLTRNTIVIVWGDHGWHLGDHGMWCKHSNYEQATRIPLLVSVPGQTPGRTTALTESVDIYPTLCDMAGIPGPMPTDGRSFSGVLRDPKSTFKEAARHVYPRGERLGRAVRTARHRLVEWKKPSAPQETAEYELYDYETDPGETKNLAAAQPAIVQQLRTLLAQEPEAKPQIRPEPPKPTQDRESMFLRRDTNQDGHLTREEFLANQPDPDKAPARFALFDADKSGTLSREEFVKQGKVK